MIYINSVEYNDMITEILHKIRDENYSAIVVIVNGGIRFYDRLISRSNRLRLLSLITYGRKEDGNVDGVDLEMLGAALSSREVFAGKVLLIDDILTDEKQFDDIKVDLGKKFGVKNVDIAVLVSKGAHNNIISVREVDKDEDVQFYYNKG